MERAPLIVGVTVKLPIRHRDADRVEVELHPRAHEERAGEELADVLPRDLLEHVRTLPMRIHILKRGSLLGIIDDSA